MTYVAHPYASASLLGSSSLKTRSVKSQPQRPKIITSSSSPATFLDAPPTSASDSSRSPSPITFARASVILPLRGASTSNYLSSNMHSEKSPSRERDEKKDRRRGLMATERIAHAGLDAFLRTPEAASARAAPQPRMPYVQLVRSQTNLSVRPNIVRQASPTSTVHSGSEGDGSAGASSRTPTPRGVSPTPSSGSGSTPSTPGQPRTPVSISIDNEFSYPVVAPLSISKANLFPSPSPPSRHSRLPALSSSPLSKSKEIMSTSNDGSLRKRRSQGRSSARTASIPHADDVFAPLKVDTVAARSLKSSHELPTLTGVLEEFEREALKIPPVPSVPSEQKVAIPTDNIKEGIKKDTDESEWQDIEDDNALEDAEYYRADIASHLQLSSSTFPPIARTPSHLRHRRGGSNSSSSSASKWQLPPSRPDSMPIPPHFRSPFASPTPNKESVPSLTLLPPLPDFSESLHFQSMRRPSTTSLASTASARSNRSTGSASSRNKNRASRKWRHSTARKSAALGVGRKHSNNQLRNRPLPPLPGMEQNKVSMPGRSRVVDRAHMEFGTKETRPPPRFSIPSSVDEEDDFFGDAVPDETQTELGRGMIMASLVEEDEDEDGRIDPFALDKFTIIDASSITLVGQCSVRREGVDPFTVPGNSEPAHTAEVDFLISPPTSSPPTQNQQSESQPRPLLLIPESPAPPSSFSGSNDSFDAESLYSSYACFSPGCDSNGSDNHSVMLNGNYERSGLRKESTESIYRDSSGRPLQSRWSVSTFASVAPPSSARSFFPIPKAVSNVPSRLSARLRAARERAVQQTKEREVKEPVVRPFPFFPTPTPPSPKRKTNPGPGRYVPKPELMPPKVRAEAEKASTESASPRSSLDTARTSHSSSSSSTARSRSSSMNSKESAPSPLKPQFAQYRAYKQSPAHYAHSISPPSSSAASSSFSCASPPRSLRTQKSTDSLSAFPFTLGGESLTPLMSAPTSRLNCNAELLEPSTMTNEQCSSGVKRRGIPRELFV